MKRVITVVFAALFATSTASQTIPEIPPPELFAPADMADLSEFLWKKRPVLVFANSEDDPAFRVQMELLREQPQDLLERDVVVLTDTDPAARSALRLKMRPRGFMLYQNADTATYLTGIDCQTSGCGVLGVSNHDDYSNSMITSSTAKLSPALAFIFDTFPFFSARRMFSIFIASIVHKFWPS